MFIIGFGILSFTNHVIIQQRVNINKINSYVNEVVMESMTNMLCTMGKQFIARNINNYRYVKWRILNLTYKNPFHKKSLQLTFDY
jgi:hypothetical protein